MRRIIISFLIGFIVAACGAGVIIYTSLERTGQDRIKLSNIERTNNELRKSNSERQDTIDKLSELKRKLESENKRFADSIAERQRIIDRARDAVKSSQDSVTKLRTIILALQGS